MVGQGQWIPVAKVGRPHGVRGELRVFPFASGSQTLLEVREVQISSRSGQKHFTLRRCRRAKDFLILALEGVDDRQRAQGLTGAQVLVDVSDLPQLDEGEFYHRELIGFSVEDDEGVSLGVLEEILDTGGHDTLVVRDRDAGFEFMIPFVEDMVEVDEGQEKLVVTPPQGLIEATREKIGA